MFLKLNVYYFGEKKTEKVDFSDIELRINGHQTKRRGEECKSESFKFVGIHQDKYLSWNSHIHVRKISF